MKILLNVLRKKEVMFPFLMNFFYFAFCNLKTTKIIIIVIGPYLGPKRNPMVQINFAEWVCYNFTLASSFIKGFTLLILVIVRRVICHSLKCNTEFSVNKTAWKWNYSKWNIKLKNCNILNSWPFAIFFCKYVVVEKLFCLSHWVPIPLSLFDFEVGPKLLAYLTVFDLG